MGTVQKDKEMSSPRLKIQHVQRAPERELRKAHGGNKVKVDPSLVVRKKTRQVD